MQDILLLPTANTLLRLFPEVGFSLQRGIFTLLQQFLHTCPSNAGCDKYSCSSSCEQQSNYQHNNDKRFVSLIPTMKGQRYTLNLKKFYPFTYLELGGRNATCFQKKSEKKFSNEKYLSPVSAGRGILETIFLKKQKAARVHRLSR